MVGDVISGKKVSIKGITSSELTVYIRDLKIRVTSKEFITKVAVADSEEVPALLGRFHALDMFDASFIRGNEFVLE